MSFWQSYKKVPLLRKLFVAMIIGIVVGAIVGPKITVIKPFGTIFLNLLRMATLPLIVVNLISGIASLDDPKIFGRIGIKIMAYYFLTTIVAIIIGLIAGFLFQPGVGFTLQGEYNGAIATIPSLGQTIVNLIPSNIAQALTEGKYDQIVVFSAFVGVAILFLPEEQRVPISKGVSNLASLFNRLIGIIMGYAPIGICALIACTVGTYGSQIFGFLAKYLGASYSAIIIHICFYCVVLFVFAKMKPFKFLKGASPLIVTALGTSSSLACVPVGMQTADDFNVPRSVSGFTIPLGSQINKDGNGMMLAITFLFAAQSINSPTPLSVLIRVIFISLILTTGAGGVPGGGIVTIAIVVESFGLPLEVVAIVSGIFSLIDMGFTMMNCLGDLVGTIIVARSEERRAKKIVTA